MTEIEGVKAVFDAEWTNFVKGELTASNERNNRALGGRQRSKSDDDDDNNRLDENMEDIMSRFNIVNTLMTKSNDDDDDDDDKQEQEEEPDLEDNLVDKQQGVTEQEHDDSTDGSHAAEYEYKRIEVTLPDSKPLEKEMTDSQYWKCDYTEESLEDLLADYE